jgi:hypothetical protein
MNMRENQGSPSHSHPPLCTSMAACCPARSDLRFHENGQKVQLRDSGQRKGGDLGLGKTCPENAVILARGMLGTLAEVGQGCLEREDLATKAEW